MQLVLKAKFKSRQEIENILTKLKDKYNPQKYKENPSQYVKEIISRSFDKQPFLVEEFITVDYNLEDTGAHRTTTDIHIQPILSDIGKDTVQLIPSTGKINLFYDDPIGKQLGLEVISMLCEEYSPEKAVENIEKGTIERLGWLVRYLTVQRQKALKVIADLLIERDKIGQEEAFKQAMKLVGIPIWPIKEDEAFKQARKEFEDAYRK
ncbi:MAG: hypothetical protein ABSB40_09925 [Nitrososphaeria archaeon]